MLSSNSNGPLIWTIGGSDSSGGAGIQADLQTAAAFGVHACTILTAVTAQSSRGVWRSEGLTPAMLDAQITAAASDRTPAAIKLGMLVDGETVRRVSTLLGREVRPFVVCDPVIRASSGVELLAKEAIAAFKQSLLPLVDLLTPNLAEAEVLSGMKIKSSADVEVAARNLLALGAGAVLIKGGHHSGPYAQDYWTNGIESAWLSSPRLPAGAHGTGCVLATAIAAAHATGHHGLDGLVIAKAYVQRALRKAHALGVGALFLRHEAWPVDPHDMPWLSSSADSVRLEFPSCGPQRLGFYPIVDRTAWLETLLPLGVSTIQLRIKDLSGKALRDEIQRAVALARRFDCRLFINDHWALALEYNAYGVHLGQEDLLSADLKAIAAARLRLGVSTHSHSEVARALAVSPSYIAVGPIYPTTTKTMPWIPQGEAGLRYWRRLLTQPLVAIGGIKLEAAEALFHAGANGVAVITDITKAPDAASRVRAWLSLSERVSSDA